MGFIAWATRVLHPFVGAPISLLAYAAVLWFTGAIDKSRVAQVRASVMRKLNRS